MRQIFVAIDGVADGVMEIDDDAELLTAIRRKYPNAKRAEEHTKGSNVIIVSTKTDDR